ncbi:MAG: hypothetical protein HY880_01830 [Deltaproteobacteria bacterium]|nr:hypothetical protein [Deltaproteobacteria bacterium]
MKRLMLMNFFFTAFLSLFLFSTAPAFAAVSEIPWDSKDASIANEDDDDVEYTLPFTFPFFGREITKINVNTNGLIELLEDGESCVECDAYATYCNGEHIDVIDAIFAANDDLITGVIIEGFADRVEVIWIGTTYDDDDFEYDELGFKAILFSNGTVYWKFFDMDYSSTDCELYTGVYDAETDTEYMVDMSDVTGEGTNKAFEFSSVQTWFEQDDEAIAYTGAWFDYICNGCYADAVKVTNKTGAKAVFTFEGTGFSWYAAKAKVCGRANVYVDGVLSTTVDLYNPTTRFRQQVFSKDGLADGSHTIEIKNSGLKNTRATGYYIDIDAFEITP